MARVLTAEQLARAAPGFDRPTAHRMADVAIRDAVRAAVDVRCEDPRTVWGWLTLMRRDEPDRLVALTVALAAMVDTEQPVSALLAWTDRLVTGETP